MNTLKDIIEIGGNLYEEAYHTGRREALKELGDLKKENEELKAIIGKLKADYRRLKPCPFCGADAEMVADLDGSYYASCSSMDCLIGPETPHYPDEQEAVDTWNRRA